MNTYETPFSSELPLPAAALDINTVTEAMLLTGIEVDDFESMKQIVAGPVEASVLADVSDDLRRLIIDHGLSQFSLDKTKSQLEIVANSALASSRDRLREYVDDANRLANRRPGQFMFASDNLKQWGYWFGMSQLGETASAVLVVHDQLVYAPLTDYQLVYADIAKLPAAEQAAVASYRQTMKV